jgi:hypothetical protein
MVLAFNVFSVCGKAKIAPIADSWTFWQRIGVLIEILTEPGLNLRHRVRRIKKGGLASPFSKVFC